MKYIFSFLMIFTIYASADDHADEVAVLAAVEKYYEARIDRDFKTMVAMESKNGVCSTNSDGSFHKACVVGTVANYKKNYPVGLNSVYFPEAIMLTEDAYLVRFYYEGVVGENDQPYRTRVTTTWVREDGNWVLRSQHYSSAAYGGLHQTARSDFED